MLHKKKTGLLSQLESFITPLSEDAEGKLRGGFAGMMAARWKKEADNTICINPVCNNIDCYNIGCTNRGCTNVGCTNLPYVTEDDDTSTTDIITQPVNNGCLM